METIARHYCFVVIDNVLVIPQLSTNRVWWEMTTDNLYYGERNRDSDI